MIMEKSVWSFNAQFLRAIDGDTYEFLMDAGFEVYPRVQIRVIGINTSEIYGNEKEQGEKARDYVSEILENADKILVVTVKNRNGNQNRSFTRYLGHVYIDGEDLAQHLIANGFAVVEKP